MNKKDISERLAAINGIFGDFSLSAQEILNHLEGLVHQHKIPSIWYLAYVDGSTMKDSLRETICGTIEHAIIKEIRLRIKQFSRSLPPIGEPLRESQIAT